MTISFFQNIKENLQAYKGMPIVWNRYYPSADSYHREAGFIKGFCGESIVISSYGRTYVQHYTMVEPRSMGERY